MNERYQDEYNVFKEDVEQIVQNHSNARFKNFESIVPGKYWGLKNGSNLSGKKELDFMHFTVDGHQLLANKLINEIRNLNDF